MRPARRTVVVLPGYSRPLIRVSDYLALIAENTYDAVWQTAAGGVHVDRTKGRSGGMYATSVKEHLSRTGLALSRFPRRFLRRSVLSAERTPLIETQSQQRGSREAL